MIPKRALVLTLATVFSVALFQSFLASGWSQPRDGGKRAPNAKVLPSDRSDAMKSFDAQTKRAFSGDYEAGRWHPIHFKPAIDTSKPQDCLTCHQEIMSDKPRVASPAGQKADDVEAWYQTLETYTGKQESFHFRHLQSPLAKRVMNLECKFCHQGHDPREQSPHVTVLAKDLTSNNGSPPFTLRKRVNPSETCLLCHGQFPAETMGLADPWHKLRADLEPEGTPNGCLTCHANIRTNRHNVSYLKAAGIEKAAETSSDTCYGCHGGRAWYRIPYPYARNAWPDMPTEMPDWAKLRPTKSDPRYATGSK